eukprot:gnl/MRDRNA2_/MRDRNA2_100354_c0_seq1.p1 gnl/MRDRNA2_/MRDRNA2_100354_c0~~gnl/MRDRNA2_/MRDRNA2_100354_c0_seq1.p1  ORF type:complete len:303 (-),score=54.13 gnl/MRDRNA2_/MRDRNA2_100354_c0_seq1:67-975(-)
MGDMKLSDTHVHTMEGHKAPVLSVRFSANGKYCMSTSQDKSVRLWNPHSGLFVKEYKGPHNHEINDIAITEDNSRFVTVGGDKFAFLWDVASGRVIRKFSGHERKINAVAFNSTETVCLTASHDKTVRIWDLKSRSNTPIQILSEASDSVLCLCICDAEIYTGSVDGGVRRYDLRAGQLTADHLLQPVSSLSLSADSACVLASTLDGAIRLLEKGSGDELAKYEGHKNSNFKIGSCLDPSDSYVVSGSEDGRVCFWELVEAKLLRSLTAHRGPVMCVRFLEEMMLTSGSDGDIKVWKPSVGP